MFKKISSELMTVFISVTVLVVLITSIVFTLLFADYAVGQKEATLTTVAESVAELVAKDEASTYAYNAKSISDYNLFTQQVLESEIWIIDSDGVFDRVNSSTSSTPYNAKELQSPYYDLYKRALQGESILTSDLSGFFGASTISVMVPVHSTENASRILGVVAVHCPMDKISQTYTSALTFLAVAVVVAILIAIVVSAVLARYVTKPLRQMQEQASLMAQGDYSVRATEKGKDEIAALAHSLNHLSETLAATVGELQVEKDKLSDIIENMSEGLASFTIEGKITRFNTTWMRICPENIAENEDFSDALQEVFETAQSVSVPIEFADVIKFTMSPIKIGNTVAAVVVIASDITKEVRLEKTRREFVSNVSHEFKTPLTIIKGNAELLIDGALSAPDDLMNAYTRIENETIALEKLVKDLLDVSRMKAGKIKLDCTEVDICGMARNITGNMKVITEKKGIDLICRTEIIRPVWGDVDRIRQLFIIFIDNAIKFTPEGGKITVSVEKVDECACITVQDTGKGMAKEDIPFIFERFYKVDKARGGSAQGTGLGLSIASSIVELHGGGITVESELGKGTAFRIMLPLVTESDSKKQ